MRGSFATTLISSVASAIVLAACSAPSSEAHGSTSNALAEDNAKTGIAKLVVRKDPDPRSASIATLDRGISIAVECQVQGKRVGGTTVWDFLPKYGGYVSDSSVKELTGSVPRCPRRPAADPATGGDATGAPETTDTPDTTEAAAASTDDGGAGLVTEARKWIGTHETGENCNPFSSALGRPCEAWCADFVQYVWQQNGMNTDGVTAYAGSFLSYGEQLGTLKARDAADVQPGDAVVWANTATDAAHVGMVSEVLENGDLRVINGNYADDVEESVSKRSSVVSGMGIAGFVSPVAP